MAEAYRSPKWGKKCVLYLRVSLERQVEGYSLDGQRDYLQEWAEREGMTVTGIYVDAGKSGKSIKGRDEFQRMISDITTGVNPADFVVVFKLSRFGRKAKDVLNSLALLQKHGCNLISKEEGLDSSIATGRMMITILGAVAEMERENISSQSKLGREEKAKQGGWNGGLPPYGYILATEGEHKGELLIKEDDAEIVRLIFNKFVNEGMGYSTIARYLNEIGVHRPPMRQKGGRTFGDWSTQQVRIILHSEFYTGRVTYGKTRQQRVDGTESDFRRVKSKDYIVSEVSHEPIIDDDLFERARLRQQQITASSPRIGRAPKHLLSGILRCPMCGSAMCGDNGGYRMVNGQKVKVVKYQCGHHAGARGGTCKKNAISAEWVETEVIEYTRRLIDNPQFAADIQAQIGQQASGPELDAEIEGYKKRLKKLETSKTNLERDIDNVVDSDRNAERKRKDMNARLDKLYDDIYGIEGQIEAAEQKRKAITQNVLTLETVHKMLGAFGELFEVMDAADRRKLMEMFVAEVQLHPKETWQKGQSPIKSIRYTFPISGEVLSALEEANDLDNAGCNLMRVVPACMVPKVRACPPCPAVCPSEGAALGLDGSPAGVQEASRAVPKQQQSSRAIHLRTCSILFITVPPCIFLQFFSPAQHSSPCLLHITLYNITIHYAIAIQDKNHPSDL